MDRVVLREQVQIKMEKLGDGFRTREAAQQEDVLAKRRRDRNAAMFLRNSHQFTHANTASDASLTNAPVLSQPIQPRRGASEPSSLRRQYGTSPARRET